MDSWRILSSLYVCIVNVKLKYNFVETKCKFIIAKLSIRKLGSSSVMMILNLSQPWFNVLMAILDVASMFRQGHFEI